MTFAVCVSCPAEFLNRLYFYLANPFTSYTVFQAKLTPLKWLFS